jgi:hypothetical protein
MMLNLDEDGTEGDHLMDDDRNDLMMIQMIQMKIMLLLMMKINGDLSNGAALCRPWVNP